MFNCWQILKKMNEIIQALTRLRDISVENQRLILNDLNSLLANCTQDLYDTNTKFTDAGLFEKLILQIINHNLSISNLSKGASINIRRTDVIYNDLTAIYSVARLQIETFVNLSYLFFIDIDISKELRICIYKIQGLNQQIHLTKHHSKTHKQVSKMRNELAKELRDLRRLDEFKLASKKQKKNYIKPKFARLIKPEEVYDLIKIGDLSKTHSLYSNHIHSEYISIRQLNSAFNNPNESFDSISTVLILCSRITCSVIRNLVTNYKLENESFSKKEGVLGQIIQILK